MMHTFRGLLVRYPKARVPAHHRLVPVIRREVHGRVAELVDGVRVRALLRERLHLKPITAFVGRNSPSLPYGAFHDHANPINRRAVSYAVRSIGTRPRPNARTISRSPECAARCNGVFPSLFTAFTLAPRYTNSHT